MSAPVPTITVTYDNVDITTDVSDGLLSFTYKDKITGETDDLEISLEDTEGKWKDVWYPKKGSKLKASMGYDGNIVPCGTFQIDEIELSGPPDVISIRAIAAFIKTDMRTKKSRGNENITLRQLAENIAKAHDLTLDDGTKTVKLKRPDTKPEQILIDKLAAYARKLSNENDNATRYLEIAALQVETYKVARALIKKGYDEEANLLVADCKLVAANMTKNNCLKFSILSNEIEIRLIKLPLDYTKTIDIGLNKILIERSTQYRESDLAYLKRIAAEYGFAFSIKGTVMVFYNIKAIEDSPSAVTVNKTDLKSYSLKDKTQHTVKGAKVKSHNPKKKEVIIVDVQAEEQQAVNGDKYMEITSDDTAEIKVRSEDKEQAQAKAKAAIHRHNSRVQEGSISVIGNPLLVAGNNFDLVDMGKYSGKWHITESTHSITKSGGYVTDLEIKRIARFTGDSAPTKGGKGKSSKRGDTTREEDLLKILAESAAKAGKIEDQEQRADSCDKIISNGQKIAQLLFDKNCSKEGGQLQSNCLMLQAFKSKENCFRFSKYCQEIRIELIRARK